MSLRRSAHPALRRGLERSYYWRHVRCDGCEQQCRYQDFRAGLPSFQEVHAVLRAEHESIGPERCRHRYKRRGTILGILHEWKLEAWERFCELCSTNKATG